MHTLCCSESWDYLRGRFGFASMLRQVTAASQSDLLTRQCPNWKQWVEDLDFRDSLKAMLTLVQDSWPTGQYCQSFSAAWCWASS